MRKGIDTVEIADTELDNISGGLASAGAEVAGHGAGVSVGDVVGTAQSLVPNLPVGQVAGLAAFHSTDV